MCARGVRNVGNTCYFAAALQCVARVPSVRAWATTRTSSLTDENTQEDVISTLLRRMVQRLVTTTTTTIAIHPGRLIHAMRARHPNAFRPGEPEDAHMVVTRLLNAWIDCAANRAHARASVYARARVDLRCATCGHATSRMQEELGWYSTPPTDGAEERVAGYACDACGAIGTSYRSETRVYAPPTLILSLVPADTAEMRRARWSTVRSGLLEDETYTLASFSSSYALFAMCAYDGAHYVALVRDDHDASVWTLFDDDVATRCTTPEELETWASRASVLFLHVVANDDHRSDT